jgi:hypothetical protein
MISVAWERTVCAAATRLRWNRMRMESRFRLQAFRCAAYLAIHRSSLRDCGGGAGSVKPWGAGRMMEWKGLLAIPHWQTSLASATQALVGKRRRIGKPPLPRPLPLRGAAALSWLINITKLPVTRAPDTPSHQPPLAATDYPQPQEQVRNRMCQYAIPNAAGAGH